MFAFAPGLGVDEILANEGLTDPDEAPEPPTNPVSKPGDLWLLGEHRLLCCSEEGGEVEYPKE